jgi:hypothetical protein
MPTQTQDNKHLTSPVEQAPDVSSKARLLNLGAAAAYLGVSYWTMRDLVISGHVPRVRLPGVSKRSKGDDMRRILIDKQDLDRLIEANKN